MSLGKLSMAENEEAPRKQLIFIKKRKEGVLNCSNVEDLFTLCLSSGEFQKLIPLFIFLEPLVRVHVISPKASWPTVNRPTFVWPKAN